MKSLRWNKRLLKYLGIWPLEIYDPLFFFIFMYLFLHCSLTFVNLIYYTNDLTEIVENFTENVLFIMTLTKITICRVNRKSLGRLLVEIENNLIVDDYNTLEKKFILLKYTKMAKYNFLITFISMTIAIGLYYIAGMIPNIKIAIKNSSLGYTLPYKTRAIINIDDTRVYFCVCLYQMLIVPIVIIGYVGFDCLFTHLAFYITAQFGILSCKVREILNDCNSFRLNIKTLVFRHYELIRQAETLEDNFNVMILQQLMGTTFHLCISGYNALVGSINQDGLIPTLFVSYAFSILSTLFIYCYIGECLIQESTNLSNAIYHYEWYNISPINLKMIYICMIRMKKPQQLTSVEVKLG
ncbi:odorant receptor 22c-like [Vespula squamosa]|uniref:Odorant receptor n=1 Tax=Vespula squamosa TaxID=30214 RepID=A0ABD2C965_VESSQ